VEVLRPSCLKDAKNAKHLYVAESEPAQDATVLIDAPIEASIARHINCNDHDANHEGSDHEYVSRRRTAFRADITTAGEEAETLSVVAIASAAERSVVSSVCVARHAATITIRINAAQFVPTGVHLGILSYFAPVPRKDAVV
jgi:hypothetical protein